MILNSEIDVHILLVKILCSNMVKQLSQFAPFLKGGGHFLQKYLQRPFYCTNIVGLKEIVFKTPSKTLSK